MTKTTFKIENQEAFNIGKQAFKARNNRPATCRKDIQRIIAETGQRELVLESFSQGWNAGSWAESTCD